jgi:hypothetical protein
VSTTSIYLHALEGRLRIKVPEVKGAPDTARQIEAQLRLIEGVDHATANPVTGSVLILYDARRTAMADITETLQTWGYLRHPVPATGTAAGTIGGGLGNLMLRATTEFALQQLLVALI